MTKSQYLDMMEQMGEEPDWEKCPPEWSDFPDVVINAYNIYNSLGSRVYPEIGYVGKDYTNFNFLLKHFGIDEHQKDYIFELLIWFESRDIEESQSRLKQERDKLSRKMK